MLQNAAYFQTNLAKGIIQKVKHNHSCKTVFTITPFTVRILNPSSEQSVYNCFHVKSQTYW